MHGSARSICLGFALALTSAAGCGRHQDAGTIEGGRIPETVVTERANAEAKASRAIAERASSSAPVKQVLFGDLHVHTTFSADAFMMALPILQGEGTHPIADACDYARYCSALDFWSITDHSESITPRRWQETQEAIRQCNAVAGDPENPDTVAFLGWEWTQIGQTPETHYGHKNVILRDTEADKVPRRPIHSGAFAAQAMRQALGLGQRVLLPLADFPNRQVYFDLFQFLQELRDTPPCEAGVDVHQLPDSCSEGAETPEQLFAKLDQWGFPALVIPHGTTWGIYTPPGSSWDKQLKAQHNDPKYQKLIEIYSGHGNSEEYRDWHEVTFDADGKAHCPQPAQNYLPSCWRAGEIIEQRCRQAGLEATECATRAADARDNYANFGVAGHLTVPGVTFEEWLDSGQCKDCFIPSFNYRPGGSTQYALAISNFDDPARPRRFHFGIIASSDNHRARPGTGYKEFGRLGMTEAAGARDEKWRRRLLGPQAAPDPRTNVLNIADLAARGFNALEAERQGSFFMTGGLVAVHANGRSRDEVWNALKRKEVYGTSGDRILLWFNLLNAPGPDGTVTSVPMGGDVRMTGTPRFEVRAVGAFKQKPGCPEYSVNALSPARLQYLCKGDCYNPSDERKRITRIEVVRIRPQTSPGEPVAQLIEDKWRTFPCEPSAAGCVVQFEDPDFVAARRPAVYYARAIEEPSPAVNGGNLRCKYDESGRCIEPRPCYGDYRTAASDDCLATIEERAWSSPIFVDAG